MAWIVFTRHHLHLICAMAEALKLESRIWGKFVEIPLVYQGLVMDTWLKQIWVQCKQVDIHISISLPNSPQQHNDVK